jgi:hypothetical protein
MSTYSGNKSHSSAQHIVRSGTLLCGTLPQKHFLIPRQTERAGWSETPSGPSADEGPAGMIPPAATVYCPGTVRGLGMSGSPAVWRCKISFLMFSRSTKRAAVEGCTGPPLMFEGFWAASRRQVCDETAGAVGRGTVTKLRRPVAWGRERNRKAVMWSYWAAKKLSLLSYANFANFKSMARAIYASSSQMRETRPCAASSLQYFSNST